jgi:poly(3-hydroxybutyrate) depolymerase
MLGTDEEIALLRNTILGALLTLGLGACGSKSTPAAGTGGAGGTGGAVGQGGTTASGGTQGAGATGSGGIFGTGGSPQSGGSLGAPGTGGATGVGGRSTSGSGGTNLGTATGRGGSGTGGDTGTGGSTGQPDASPPRDAKSGDVAKEDAAADALAPRPDASAVACPSTNTLKAGDSTFTLQHGGLARSYRVYVPSSVKAGSAVPLIFDFHGHGGNASQEESSSGWKKKADQVGFVMVYPEGYDSSWNVGSCCGKAMSENVDDVGFTKAILEAVSKAACIDRKRVYATGMSNGAGFVHRVGCEAADAIAAIAAASADLVTDPCTPARPISELSVRGLSDTMVAYEGGKTGSTGWYSPGAKGTLELWKKIDQCTGAVQTSRQYCETYSTCAAGVEVTLCSLPNTGHDTYNNAVAMSVPDVAWEMFQRQPMP